MLQLYIAAEIQKPVNALFHINAFLFSMLRVFLRQLGEAFACEDSGLDLMTDRLLGKICNYRLKSCNNLFVCHDKYLRKKFDIARCLIVHNHYDYYIRYGRYFNQ